LGVATEFLIFSVLIFANKKNADFLSVFLCQVCALGFTSFTQPALLVIARNCDQIAKQLGRVTKQSIFFKHQILILRKHGLLRRRLFCSRKTNEAPSNDEFILRASVS
jgi:hypothetical protein